MIFRKHVRRKVFHYGKSSLFGFEIIKFLVKPDFRHFFHTFLSVTSFLQIGSGPAKHG